MSTVKNRHYYLGYFRQIKYYKAGDCVFEDIIEIESLDSRWMFNCGFTEMNSTTGILTGDMIKVGCINNNFETVDKPFTKKLLGAKTFLILFSVS